MNARRAGFTLVELLIVAVIGTIVLASVYQTLTVQERSIRQAYAIIGTQQNTRMASEVVVTDLREVSATDGDITGAGDAFVDFRGLRKAAVACVVDPAGAYVDVAMIGDLIIPGDSVVIFSDGADPAVANDDSWIVRRVTGVTTTANCAGHPLSANIRRLQFAVNLVDVAPGALVRSFVPVRYRLVDNGQEGVLTRIETRNTPSGTVTDSVPLIEDLATIANEGLRFRFWDTARVAIPTANLATNLNNIGRVQVKVRGIAVGGQTGAQRMFSDSLVTNIQLRGNRKMR